MDSGRRERRSPKQQLEVLLSTGEQPILSELALTENASSCGLRVLTEQPWKPDTPLLVRSPQGGWVRARVVYCQGIDTKSFAVGLEFATRTRTPSSSNSQFPLTSTAQR